MSTIQNPEGYWFKSENSEWRLAVKNGQVLQVFNPFEHSQYSAETTRLERVNLNGEKHEELLIWTEATLETAQARRNLHLT